MKKEHLRKDLEIICIVFLVLVALFWIVYNKETLAVIIRYAFSLTWLFFIPGYMILSIWRDKIDTLERIIGGITLGAALLPLFAYHLALLMHLKYLAFGLPVIFIVVSIFYQKNSSPQQSSSKNN